MNFSKKKMGTHVYWGTDSENVVTFWEKGSSKSWIQKEVLEIILLCHKLKTNLTVYHLRREDPRIMEVDGL